MLPVNVDGAFLYFGDCKARMADGEIAHAPEVGTLDHGHGDRPVEAGVDALATGGEPTRSS